ncbi:prepilin-type N-terminal cleavage/methylation domain-containing protein [Roseateles sp.]|uniref:prepilin-type N-terminal cleavage/methylation domain-containing protein n=1 Tax=Roseateles sp. TaxID=1971397 RepID=UPI0025EE85FD|nr:prepilin-type N-terminal cleavage/methylation domain-containing protein [Roseateles sp.]MBV8034330.1 prepilin-type N-terminal cleavage/methylation domain-containing protein [Roseateles sp.]
MNPPRRISRGFSLIEMLVGILIVSFGLLGLITLQARALQVSVSSEDSQRAALLASEIAAQMFNQNTVNLNPAVVTAWATRVANPANGGVPNGTGTVSVTNATTARVTVTWTPVQSTGAVNDTHTYFTDVVIPQ